ncbi:protein transport protein Sec24B isoform X2 [Canis lupus familiaris]|uniref:SEC24 homolog B, COPII coat complex component n=1 Tax=Canis lupus familiaris TaxID=9615 RepID=A0A8C0RS65_CANLF|nr:protein transport protein Sec24B isoform X2 [Canis lupus familiaris]|eukprot:XP_003434083.1 protein transport protein Sec24B isoform X2 [Canis lupus familiaris]
MSAPAESPHPAASARIPPKLGGASASGAAAPAGPGPAPHQQNGPAQNQMQIPSGYGLHPQNYIAPSGHYPQGPGKMTSLPLDSQCGDYYSGLYTVPTQNMVTPNTANQQPGAQQMYGRGPPAPHIVGSTPGSFQGATSSTSHLHTSASQPYSPFVNHYSSPAMYPANSSVASQGFPSTCGHYAMSTVSNAAYPSVSYPSLPAGDPYGQQMFTSQNAPTVGPVREDSFPGHSTAISHPAPLPPPPSHQYHQQQGLSGCNTLSWSASGLPSAQDNLTRNHTGSLATPNSNPTNTVSDSLSCPVMQNVQPLKSSPVVSTVLGASSTRVPPAANRPVEPVASVTQPSELLQQKGVDSSSTTSSASPMPNSYDALEGGSYPDMLSSSASSPAPDPAPEPDPAPVPAPSAPQPSKMAKPFGYGYPTLQPGYQNATAPLNSGVPPSSPMYSGFQPYAQQYPGMNQLSSSLGGLSLQSSPQPESLRPVNLTQERNILPMTPVWPPVPNLNLDLKKLNCSPDSFRCTLTNIPQTQALLNKAKLPLGLLLHPFRDLTQLPVITSNTIVRCRSCRTYINPFVSFIDQRRWKCNLCYRVNDVPEEFMYNPVTRSYGEPHKRPEVQNSTVEFIASSDYMLRPPQPAVYLFVLDVSHNAVEAGYLTILCQSLLENLDKLPGDSRTRIGFMTFDSTIHFYNLQEGLSQPQMLIVSDIDDVFLPTPDSLLVNLYESKELIKDLLNALPNMFTNTRETHSALGPALQAAFKLMSPTGGRVSVFQTQLPSLGAGLLQSREDPNQRSSTKVVQHLGPATDFYKKLALDCSGQQTAVDLFLLSSQYSDLASLACMSKYSAGCIYYYPSFHFTHNPSQAEKLQKDLKRYLTRKIGFEAVMRIRCTKGLSMHTFHGNFFVRSTDLLSLANINPDAGFAVQLSIEENLTDTSLVCFQTALLYTSSKGERRIRVHTLCLPVVSSLADVYAGVDVQAAICLLANMAVDRSISSSLSDARDALVNAVVDSLSAYGSTVSNLQHSALIAPSSLKLFPLYVLALLKQKAFRTGTSTRLDDRVYAMCQIKCQPLVHLMKMIHPNLYRIDRLTDEGAIHVNDRVVPQPPLQKLSAEKLTREGAFLMDCGSVFYIWIGKSCDNNFIEDVLGYPNFASIPQKMTHLPELDTLSSERARSFITWLRDNRPLSPILHVVKDESPAKTEFFQHLIEDRTEAAFSYYEFLLHIQQQICK